MEKKVLIFQGGWDGHEPKLTSARFGKMMEAEGYAVEIYDTLDCLADAEFVAGEVRRRFGTEDIRINYVGPVIGNHSGPGTLALFFLGTQR